MAVFLAGALPVSYFIVISALMHGDADRRLNLKSLLRGFAVSVPAYLIYLLIKALVPLQYTAKGLYLYSLFHYSFYYIVLSIGGYIIISGLNRNVNRRNKTLEVLAFLCGFYLLLGFADIFAHMRVFNILNLFMIPLTRIAIVFFSASVIAFSFSSNIFAKLAPLIIILFGGAVATVPLLFFMNFIPAAFGVIFILFTASGGLFFFAVRE